MSLIEASVTLQAASWTICSVTLRFAFHPHHLWGKYVVCGAVTVTLVLNWPERLGKRQPFPDSFIEVANQHFSSGDWRVWAPRLVSATRRWFKSRRAAGVYFMVLSACTCTRRQCSSRGLHTSTPEDKCPFDGEVVSPSLFKHRCWFWWKLAVPRPSLHLLRSCGHSSNDHRLCLNSCWPCTPPWNTDSPFCRCSTLSDPGE